ncbi:hypothetical protein CYMTET_13029 [Cymbomonas tetramitiformis]|uniref:Receptor ligand binding region domain-containing protein n=1 Tax=Cymbomonas tetramitiformis TaxID=36881 RepID=A0AAE0GJ87_9CHLO|nr:hypothetical protein CYMTET_13029 [Cymbomonas tetramitiformis]
MYGFDFGPLMAQAYAENVGGDGYVWIGSESTVHNWNAKTNFTEEEVNNVFRGFLGVKPHINVSSPEFVAFVERWRSQPATIDEATGECSTEEDDAGSPIWMRYDVDNDTSTYDLCVGMNYSKDIFNQYVPYFYDATYVVARALHQLLQEERREEVVGAELKEAMLAQEFAGVSGRVAFDSAGDRSSGLLYEVVNHAGNSSLRHVALWSEERGFEVCQEGAAGCHEVVWSTGDNKRPKSRFVNVGAAVAIATTSGEDLKMHSLLSAIVLAIRDANDDDTLLQDFQLRIAQEDSKCDGAAAVDAAFSLQEWGAVAVVGTVCSLASVQMQDVLQHYAIPQVSGSASSSSLAAQSGGTSGRDDPYPYFMRTIGSNVYEARAAADVVDHYNWTRVVTVSVDDVNGHDSSEAFLQSATALGITVVDQLTYQEGEQDFSEVVDRLRESHTFIIVTFAYTEDLGPLMWQAYAADVGGDGYVWIGSESLMKDSTWMFMSHSLTEEEVNNVFRGFLGVKPHINVSSPEFVAFVERWRSQPATIDEATGECSTEEDDAGSPIWMRYDMDNDTSTYDLCVGMNYSRPDATLSKYVPYFYDATYVVARALHQLLQEERREEVVGAELKEAMLAQDFAGVSGRVAFDSAGDRAAGCCMVVNHAGNSSLRHVALWVRSGVRGVPGGRSGPAMVVLLVNGCGISLCSVQLEFLALAHRSVGTAVHKAHPPSQAKGRALSLAWEGRLPTTGDSEPPLDGQCADGEVFYPESQQCKECPAGTFHNVGSSACEDCLPGTITAEAGALACSDCRDIRPVGGYYQDGAGQAECKVCPEGADCSSGTSTVGKAGYWRDSHTRDRFYGCYSKDACLGESEPYDGPGCSTGHEGPLCAVCAGGYARKTSFTHQACELCHTDTYLVPWVMLLFVMAMVILVVIYYPLYTYQRRRQAMDSADVEAENVGMGVAGELLVMRSNPLMSVEHSQPHAQETASNGVAADNGAAVDTGVAADTGVAVDTGVAAGNGELADVTPYFTSKEAHREERIRGRVLKNAADVLEVATRSSSWGALLWRFSLGKEIEALVVELQERGFDAWSVGAEILQTIISFLQVTSVFGSFQVDWPPILSFLFTLDALGVFSGFNILGIQCPLQALDFDEMYINWLVLAALLPAPFLIQMMARQYLVEREDQQVRASSPRSAAGSIGEGLSAAGSIGVETEAVAADAGTDVSLERLKLEYANNLFNLVVILQDVNEPQMAQASMVINM